MPHLESKVTREYECCSLTLACTTHGLVGGGGVSARRTLARTSALQLCVRLIPRSFHAIIWWRPLSMPHLNAEIFNRSKKCYASSHAHARTSPASSAML